MKKRCFTLLEVMIGLALILIASGLTGWKMHQMVVKKRFQSDLARLQSRFMVCQRLAVAMQADWRGVLKKQGRDWVFETVCIDAVQSKKLAPLHLHSFFLFENGRKAEEICIDFFSSGHVLPEGTFLFYENLENPGGQKIEWKLPGLFQKESSHYPGKSAPLYP